MNARRFRLRAGIGIALVLVVSAILFALKLRVVEEVLTPGEAKVAARPASADLVRDHAPVLGASGAKVEIVEFLDPACEGCAGFHPTVRAILDAYPGRVKLVVRHLPFHAGADRAVLALEAAREQGKYADLLSAMLADQREWASGSRVQEERLMRFLERQPLDYERLRRDMANPAYRERLALDLADAKAIGVRQTPDFYVDGRPLPTFGTAQLEAAVRAAVARAYR